MNQLPHLLPWIRVALPTTLRLRTALGFLQCRPERPNFDRWMRSTPSRLPTNPACYCKTKMRVVLPVFPAASSTSACRV